MDKPFVIIFYILGLARRRRTDINQENKLNFGHMFIDQNCFLYVYVLAFFHRDRIKRSLLSWALYFSAGLFLPFNNDVFIMRGVVMEKVTICKILFQFWKFNKWRETQWGLKTNLIEHFCLCASFLTKFIMLFWDICTLCLDLKYFDTWISLHKIGP